MKTSSIVQCRPWLQLPAHIVQELCKSPYIMRNPPISRGTCVYVCTDQSRHSPVRPNLVDVRGRFSIDSNRHLEYPSRKSQKREFCRDTMLHHFQSIVRRVPQCRVLPRQCQRQSWRLECLPLRDTCFVAKRVPY